MLSKIVHSNKLIIIETALYEKLNELRAQENTKKIRKLKEVIAIASEGFYFQNQQRNTNLQILKQDFFKFCYSTRDY